MPELAKKRQSGFIKALLVLAALYAFIVSIETLGTAFNMMGRDFADQLIRTTSNPIIGLFIGLLVTSIIQSSSVTTSLVVALVAAKTLTIGNAVPIVMGANIGTTITNTLVSLGSMGRRDEFRRAMGAATVHDFFNILCVCIFLPTELLTRHLGIFGGGRGFLETCATWLAREFNSAGGLTVVKPLDYIAKPVAEAGKAAAASVLPAFWDGLALAVVALVVLFFALVALVKVMRAITEGRFEVLFDKYVGRYPYLAFVIGLVVTGIIQSSSVVTSLLVPIAGAGILTVEQIYPVTLGANIGTTVTALLAALALGKWEGLAIALVHTLFNTFGTIIFFVIAPMRIIPITLAKTLAALCARTRIYAILFVVVVFFLIPGVAILIQKLLGGK
jgi:sodium-dependent phosphate cotransporter